MRNLAKNRLMTLLLGLGALGSTGTLAAQEAAQDAASPAADGSAAGSYEAMPPGDPERGRLIFGQCRACHYPEPEMGHNNGPNLHRIFGKVAGKQEGFEHYSETFRDAQFVWTPELLWLWLANPLAMFPDTTMMSRGVADPQDRADLVAYLMRASVRGVTPGDEGAPLDDASPDAEEGR